MGASTLGTPEIKPATAKAPAVRSDPVRRPTDGMRPNSMNLRNADERRWYVWVNKTSPELGPDYYADMGYEVEHYKKGGVNCIGGSSVRSEGDVIERRGAVLMSCTSERHEEILKYGPDGNTGQELANLYEKQIVREEAAWPNVQGLEPRHVRVHNETTPLEPED